MSLPFVLIAITTLFYSTGLVRGVSTVVQTDCGQLEGKELDTPRGQCDAYLGVPFAEAPIGDLRWKKPQPPKCWTGVKKVVRMGPRCVSFGSNGTESTGESEDCLYMNIFVPKSKNQSTTGALPVMVFIHGGAFIFGSAQEYGDKGPCETLATRGVIVAVIQYRLFVYGLFSTGDKTAPGNYAIWDQIEALKWIKTNIKGFGGDPNRVTIFGESAGGASVSYITYTKEAKDLFHRSISQSGSALASWAQFRNSSMTSALTLAKAANCTGPASESYVNCLRRLSTTELQNVLARTGNLTTPAFFEVWSIRPDGELYPEQQLEDFAGDTRPSMIGVNTMEFPGPIDSNSSTPAIVEFEKLVNKTFSGSDSVRNNVLRSIAKYVYIDSKGDRNDTRFVQQQISKFQVHIGFHAPAAREATSKAATGRPVWVYNFDFWSENVFPQGYRYEKGAPHAHELCYLFRMKVVPEMAQYLTCPMTYDGTYGRVAEYLGEMWTNFAIKGLHYYASVFLKSMPAADWVDARSFSFPSDPSSSELVWPKFRNVANASSMTIRSNLTIEDHYYLDYNQFWNRLKDSVDGAFGLEPSSNAWSMP